MIKSKNVSVSFRVSSHFKHLLEAAAALERRSQTNMIEMALFAYCEERGIRPSHQPSNTQTPPQGVSS